MVVRAEWVHNLFGFFATQYFFLVVDFRVAFRY